MTATVTVRLKAALVAIETSTARIEHMTATAFELATDFEGRSTARHFGGPLATPRNAPTAATITATITNSYATTTGAEASDAIDSRKIGFYESGPAI